MKKKSFILFLALVLTTLVNAQNYWKKLEFHDSKSKTKVYPRKQLPTSYLLFTLDLDKFTTHLNTQARGLNTTIISLPGVNGESSRFKIQETSIFESKLAEKFPTIKSYTATGIDDPTATAKISMGTDGVHVLITSGNHDSFYIDPHTKDNRTYIAYKRSDFIKNQNDFECKIDELKEGVLSSKKTAARNANDGKLRTFRIALACTGEYSQFHLNNQGVPASATDATKKAAILSAMNTTMTRVNQIYERDLAVRMIIVNNNDKIIFLDPNTDNLSNTDANALIDESQKVCDTNILDANYDIGHTFSTGGGGLAGLGVVCVSGEKGKGITGSPQPISDPYDIDYVAHEVGHQFGATHTFNNSCDGNRSGSTAVEPGSGSSIMAYAGICSPNVQSNSDDHFHAVSIKQMWNKIQTTASCAVQTNTNNNPPTTNAGADVSIPKSTPFVLRGQATDIDGTSKLTYNWEQLDTEIAIMPPIATNLGGPLFRSLPSKTVPNRYFPNFATVLAGKTSTEWEVLPSVARNMNFSFTVRDNNAGGGASARDDIKVTVVDAIPFTISNQATWAQNTSRTISWVVGQSNIAPINCKKVNIKLSTDGGTTFNDLATNVDNDGEEIITLPSSTIDTDNAIIMIEAADNIFYNITPAFTISSKPDFAISNKTGDAFICNTIVTEYTFDIDYTTSNGFSETVTLTATKKPTGSTVQITPSTITSNGTFQVKATNLGTVADGEHIITLNAKSSSIEKNLDIKLTITNGVCQSSGNTDYQTGTTYVKFNTIENQTLTKNNGYNDFKAITTIVNRGENHQLTIKTNTDGDYSSTTFAWIDWNQNCQFDENEKYDLGTVTNNSNGQTSLSPLNIEIPNDAKLGTTTLRVSTKFAGDGAPSVCEINFDGEVEDYSIEIKEKDQPSSSHILFNNFKLYPNPSSGVFTLSFDVDNKESIILKIFDIRGRLIEYKIYDNSSNIFTKDLVFSGIKAGIYLLQVENKNKSIVKKIIIK
ncbi:reprolysin-like metallopeptidase [Tenacibaculum sp. TC6]|uniref:zinc-dependent metalloprotease n=1 Tax=Tenacibaculum sp. TC6 TaxID=3423223 RepID=UPI003D3646ED